VKKTLILTADFEAASYPLRRWDYQNPYWCGKYGFGDFADLGLAHRFAAKARAGIHRPTDHKGH
jgi:hypothetical protein